MGKSGRASSEVPGWPSSLVVGIGASAGGLAAFRSFFDHLPADTGMSFVLVQHLDPTHESRLAELLRAHTAMEVVEAQDGTMLTPNRVHVIVPNATLTLEGDALRVSVPAPPREYRRPIDTFFISLAENQRERAVGIILSGVGSDGSLGIKAIKEHGGFTLAQAEFDETPMTGMPRSAAATGLVDHVAPVEGLPARLVEHQGHLSNDTDDLQERIRESLDTITGVLRRRLKHDFSGYKSNTMIRRILRRMQVLQIENVKDYVELLRRDPPEGDALFQEFLIGVTQFFRDEDAFEVVKVNFLPLLLAAREPDDPIRIWVAGCATGEEVYSIAILLQETITDATPVTIFGTDIDTQAIAIARAGRFRRMTGMSDERLQRWFVKDGEDYVVVRGLRDMCVFSEHNLIRDPPFSKIDLISCRNVLIYMDNAFQHRVMQTFHYALRPGGYLFLGPSESVSREQRLFSPADKKHRILKRRDTVRAVLPELQPSSRTPLAVSVPNNARNEDQVEKNVRRVMGKHFPAYFVIDRYHNIVQFSGGKTGRYLEPSEGKASLSFFANLAKDLRPQVRRAVETALASGQAVEEKDLSSPEGGHFVDLVVEPITEAGKPAEMLVVAFLESRSRKVLPGSDVEKSPAALGDVEALQRDFRALQVRHQATSDELESQIENMKSVTEEYQSVNEELQSSNEELETAKEEMQSVNEELQTVNRELQGKNDLLMQANSDLQNLLDNTQIATLFLDDNLRIRNFTPAAVDVFSLRDTDRGRPITEIVSALSYDKLSEDIRKVQRDLSVVENELSLKDETATYLMRIRPYRTIGNVISGVVVTFNDITEHKRQVEQLQILMKELQHRTNNLFAVIQAMARQTARSSTTFDQFEAQFEARIQGLSQSNKLLIEGDWKGASLYKLIELQMTPFVGSDLMRVETLGPPLTVAASVVQTLGLALHELATNASKYGALSVPDGRIVLSWSLDSTSDAPASFRLEWREHGGPPVKPSTRKGFGRFVTDQMVSRALNATVKTDFAQDGLQWIMKMPASDAVVPSSLSK